MSEQVVTDDRAGRLRIALWAALVPAVLGVVAGAHLLLVVVPDEPDALRYAVAATAVATLATGALLEALRRLRGRDHRARAAVRVAAVGSLLAALLLLPVGVGYFLGLVGVMLALLAFLPDEPA